MLNYQPTKELQLSAEQENEYNLLRSFCFCFNFCRFYCLDTFVPIEKVLYPFTSLMDSAIYECKFLSVRPITISGFRFCALWLVEVKTQKITLAERYWKWVDVEQYFWCSHLRQSAETKFSTKLCTGIPDIQTYKSWQFRTLRTNSSFERRGLPPAKPKKMFILQRTRHWSNQESSKPVFTLLKREWAILSCFT